LWALVASLITIPVTTWWNSSAPHLSYTVADVFQFPGEKTKLAMTTLSILNDGNKEAESVECWLRLEGSSGGEVNVSPKAFKTQVAMNGDTATIDLTRLNPKEQITIQVLSNMKTDEPSQPSVSVRAKGVVGSNSPLQTSPDWMDKTKTMFAGLGVASGVLMIFVGVHERITSKTKKWNQQVRQNSLDGDNSDLLGTLSTTTIVVQQGKDLPGESSQFWEAMS